MPLCAKSIIAGAHFRRQFSCAFNHFHKMSCFIHSYYLK